MWNITTTYILVVIKFGSDTKTVDFNLSVWSLTAKPPNFLAICIWYSYRSVIGRV